MIQDIQATLAELKYCHDFVQQVRSIIFLVMDEDENADKKALTILADYALEWLKHPEPRLTDFVTRELRAFCETIIKAGSKTRGPEMPEPLRVGMRYKP